jgi:hypothetical protein
MTKRHAVAAAPSPLEEYARHFDPLFSRANQRQAFRQYLEGLLLPAERNKTLTALANTEPLVAAQRPEAQALQWFLSESTWDPDALNQRRLELLCRDPLTAPTAAGALVIDEHGDRKRGAHTAHVGKQYLANIGKVDTGVVSVTSLWADERVSYPLHVVPYTPAHHFARGKNDPQFRTKLQLALELVDEAREAQIPFRAVVADCFYGEDEQLKRGLRERGVGYVLALKPSHSWWHLEGTVGALWEVAEAAGWQDEENPGQWVRVERQFRDGHTETWWALEVQAGPYGVERAQRAIVATTDPATLPDLTTWYLVTNLAAPGSSRAAEEGALPAAEVAEIVGLYGLRNWVEQSYKQTRGALGWSQYQVRSDLAIRRHWQLVCCAFSFCWYHQRSRAAASTAADSWGAAQPADRPTPASSEEGRRGENQGQSGMPPAGVLAGCPATGEKLAGAVDHAGALLARMVEGAPAARASAAA